MGYSKEVYRIASAKLAERRAKAEREAEERRTAFFAACPRALEIEREKHIKQCSKTTNIISLRCPTA